MTDITALIAEARDWASKAVLVGSNVIRDLDRGVAQTRRLADALEAEHKRAEEAEGLAVRFRRKWWDARAERDRYRAALDRVNALEPMWPRGMYGCPQDMFGRSQITRALNEGKTDDR